MANVKSKKPAKKKGGRATSAQKSVKKANVKKKANQTKNALKAYRREKKALAKAVSGSTTANSQRKAMTAGRLEAHVRSGTATKAESSAFRASHEQARVKSGIYGTAKRTASAITAKEPMSASQKAYAKGVQARSATKPTKTRAIKKTIATATPLTDSMKKKQFDKLTKKPL